MDSTIQKTEEETQTIVPESQKKCIALSIGPTFGDRLLSITNWFFPLAAPAPGVMDLPLLPERKSCTNMPLIHHAVMLTHYGLSLASPSSFLLEYTLLGAGLTSLLRSLQWMFSDWFCPEFLKNEEKIATSCYLKELDTYSNFFLDQRGLNTNKLLDFLNTCGLWIPAALKWWGYSIPTHCVQKLNGFLVFYNAGSLLNFSRKQLSQGYSAPRFSE